MLGVYRLFCSSCMFYLNFTVQNIFNAFDYLQGHCTHVHEVHKNDK